MKSDDKDTICTCNHLTNFAIFMQVGKLEDEVCSEQLTQKVGSEHQHFCFIKGTLHSKIYPFLLE